MIHVLNGCANFAISTCLVIAGVILLKKIKGIVSEYPKRLLSWTFLVFIISFFRGASIVLQLLTIFNEIIDDKTVYAIYYFLLINFFEGVPMLIYLKVIMISSEDITAKGLPSDAEDSMSSLFKSMLSQTSVQ